jgi:hypothetical protein
METEVVDHRFIVNRHELLAYRKGERVKPGSRATSEDNAFAAVRRRLALVMGNGEDMGGKAVGRQSALESLDGGPFEHGP